MGEILLLTAAGLLLYAAYTQLQTGFDFLPGDAMNGNQPQPVPDAKVQLLEQAIEFAEGFGKAGAIPTLANNPGDLELGDVGLGVLGEGITIYPDVAIGRAKLTKIVRGWLAGVSSSYSLDDSFLTVAQEYVGGKRTPTVQAGNWALNVVTYLNTNAGVFLTTSNTLRDWVNA